MVMQTDGQVVAGRARAAAASATTASAPGSTLSGGGGGAEGVIDAEVQVVVVAVYRSHEMKVLLDAGQVGQRDVGQQALRDRADGQS